MRSLAAALRIIGFAALLLLAGCIVWPTRFNSHQDDGTHKRIDWSAFLDLDTHHMTRDQVTAQLGRRDVELAGNKIWVYSWETRDEFAVYLAAFGPYGGGGREAVFDPSKMHYLILEFDDAGILTRKTVRHGGTLNGLATNWDNVMIK